MVYVLNSIGKPLMPCSNSKARKLLKAGKAKIVRRDIFTIQLLYRSNNYRQETTLGIDAGSKHVGFSVTTEKQELISGTAELRTNVAKLLSDRRMRRKTRRLRNTRYRKTRFYNRSSSKMEGRLAPSIKQKIKSHTRIVLLLNKILPINCICIEVAAFDIQKIKNPDINSYEYQHGEQYGFNNIREYVFFRDGHICQCCKGKSKDNILQIHHIESRRTGGNAPNNLITLCKTCHSAYHRGCLNLNIKRGLSLKHPTEMNVIRWKIIDDFKKYFPNTQYTYGYITKFDRIKLGLPKEHYNDAFCITKKFKARKLDKHHIVKFVSRHRRILHADKPSKGGKRRLANAAYWLNNTNFTRYDKVLFNGKEYFISGSTHGAAVLKKFDINASDNFKPSVTTRKLKFITHRHGSMVIL